jgi:hypothetical protein
MDEEWESIISRFLGEHEPRLIRNQVFNEYAMEATRDTICYIKPMYAEDIDLSFDLKRKRKRCINI